MSGDHKTYAYLINSTKDKNIKTVCKVNGVTLNHKQEQFVNFEALRDMILDYDSEKPMSVQIEQKQIRRAKDN